MTSSTRLSVAHFVASDGSGDRRASWNERLAGTAATCFHHGSWPGLASCYSANAHPRLLEFRGPGGALAAVAAASYRRSSRRLVGSLTSELNLDAMPLIMDPETTAPGVLEALEDYARAQGCVTLSIRGYGDQNNGPILSARGFDVRRRYEFMMDLRLGEEELFAGMEPQRRNKIRKARKGGVSIEVLGSMEAAKTFHDLHVDTVKRIREKGAEMDDPLPEETLEKAFNYLEGTGLGRILAARVGDETVSVAVFASFNSSAYFILSATSPAGLKAQAPSLLLWEAMLHFMRSGCTEFNLGGCAGDATDSDSPEHGLYVSKMGFGPARVDCAAGEKILRPVARHGRRLLEAVRAPFHGLFARG